MKKFFLAAAMLALFSSSSYAQTVSGDRFTLNTGPCTVYSGSGSPEGVKNGKYCDKYFQTDNDGLGATWIKVSGTGNTGWKLIPPFHLEDGVVVFGSTALVRQTAAGSSDTYRSDWYVDYDGSTHFDSYNSTGSGEYKPLVIRASTLSVQNPITATGAVGNPNYVADSLYWQVTADGAADLRYIKADQMRVKIFTADLEQALNGGQIIAKSTPILASDFTMPATSGTATLVLEDFPSAPNMAVFESGDTIRLRTFSRAAGTLTITDAWGTVSSYVDGTGTQSWTFTRLAGAAGGAMATGTVIAAKSLAIDYGTTGNGLWEVNAADGAYNVNGPYARIFTWASTPATQTTRTQMGQLKNITGSSEYGFFAGKNYATTNGQYLVASDSRFELHGIDLSLWQSTTKTVFLDHSGPSFALGNPVPSAYGTGTGIWMGNDGGTYKFRVGDPAGNYIRWTGSALEMVGKITATTGAIGGWLIDSSNIYTNTGGAQAGISSYDDGTHHVRFWAGDSTQWNAPFQVWQDGRLIASNANITGTITATSGSFTGTVTATAGAIGGCTIATTTVTCGGAVLSSSGIAATAGTIGGFTLGSTQLVGSNNVFLDGSATHSYDVAISVGNSTPSSAPFQVNGAGDLIIRNITIPDVGYAVGLLIQGAYGRIWMEGAYAGSGNQFVCVDNSGVFYPSTSACTPAPSSEIERLRRDVAELRALISKEIR